MTFFNDEKPIVIQLITNRIEPRFNRTKQYFLPYLLNSSDEFIDIIIYHDRMYLGDDNYLYIKYELKENEQVEDAILKVYEVFKSKGKFLHKISYDGELYLGVEVPTEMCEYFREGKYSKMYDYLDLKSVFTESMMMKLFEEYKTKYGIDLARRNYFYLKKSIYTLTKDADYYGLITSCVEDLFDELDFPPSFIDLLNIN